MSITQRLPPTARPIKTANSFDADFNSPTVGKYDFGKAGNTGVSVLTLRPKSLYFIERVNFSLDIDEGTFKRSISTTLQCNLKYLSTGLLVFGSGLPLLNYLSNFEIHQFFGTTGKHEEELQADFTGVLNQVADTAGDAEIVAYVSFSIYQIHDDKWMRAWESGEIDRL